MNVWQKARAAVYASRRASELTLAMCEMAAECEFRASQLWVRELVVQFGVWNATRLISAARSHCLRSAEEVGKF